MKNSLLAVLLGIVTIGFSDSLAQAAPTQDRFPPGLIRFTNADVLQVLDLYQELSGRTVLRTAVLPWKDKITLSNEKELTRSETLKLVEQALAKVKITITPESEKFVYVLPADRKGKLPRFDPKAMAEKLGKSAKPEEVFPPGLIRFVDAPPEKVLPIYASLAGRKAIPTPAYIPPLRFNLRTQMPMTRAEGLFAVEAVAALNNLQFTLVGDDEVILEQLKQNPR
jgi:hypothetical protein